MQKNEINVLYLKKNNLIAETWTLKKSYLRNSLEMLLFFSWTWDESNKISSIFFFNCFLLSWLYNILILFSCFAMRRQIKHTFYI